MSGNDINRRDFLKFMGLGGVGAATLTGCDMPTTVTLEEGKEKVVSYLAPEEYVIPGIGVWYASTCQQCPSGCSIHGRVREGRVLKVEGNPESSMNGTGLCQMAHAGLQGHYNPDRLSKPLVRKGGKLTEASWEEAWALVEEKLGARTAWLTGTISGHQAVLLDDLKKALGSNKSYAYEAINNGVGEALNKAVLGEATPRYRFDKAQSVLSFGADFLGTWVSPVHFTKEYAQKFRTGERGVLMVVEPKMTMTGANADFWVPARPGTEGALALGIANVLLHKHQVDGRVLPKAALDVIAKYSLAKTTDVTGVRSEAIVKMANYLRNNSPSIILSGPSAHEHANGSQNAAAAMLLNILLGNVGKTIESSGEMPVKDIAARPASSKAIVDFVADVGRGDIDAVVITGTNPVFTAPKALGVEDKLSQVPFKVALSMFIDETSALADVVLPLASSYEDWGTSVAAYQPHDKVIGVQQPLMQPLYKETKGLGDVLLSLLKSKGVDGYAGFDDYYAYLRKAFSDMPASVKQGKSDKAFWSAALQSGLINVGTASGSIKAKAPKVQAVGYEANSDYPFHLVPSARQGLWDGRHANIPWMQEAPDQVSKVFWDSWAEIHPKTANALGVKEGDFIRIESDQGVIETQVYIFKGVHPDVVAVPMGQGHENYGRYATGVGVNPLKILSPTTDESTGELANHATRVRVAKTGAKAPFPRLGGSEQQAGRLLVGTVTADVFRKTEGGDHVA